MRQYSTFRVQEDYAVPILEVLADMPDHQAPRRVVIERIGERYADFIPARHRERVPTGTAVRWQNWVAWQRFDLVQLGLMESPAHGIWGISAAGLEWLQQNPAAISLATASGKPKPRAPQKKARATERKRVARRQPSERDLEERALGIYRRESRAVREFLAGRRARPSDERLCDWVQFCYTFELYLEGDRLFQLVDGNSVNDWLYRRTERMAKLCAMRGQS